MIDVGVSVGNYIVKSKLGEGGMGIVWLAEHPLIGKRVAIKVIHPSYARNPEAVSRFFTEAQAVNRVGHPNIVDITDFGQSPAGESYFVMEFLSGQSLAQRMQGDGLDLRRAVHVAAQACDALAASHAAGILHRDLKPDNIYLVKRGADPDFVKVLDFGLAKLTGEAGKASQHKTRTGSMMGTPFYMAPEQCAGKADIDARADIYSMGVILFELVTGKVPFPGEGYGEIIVKHMTQPAPRARELNPSVPEWLDETIDRCLAKERGARVQTMGDLGAILGGELAKMPGGAPTTRAHTSTAGSSPPRNLASVAPEAVRPISTMNLASGEAATSEPAPKKRSFMVLGGAIGAAAIVVIGIVATRGGGSARNAATPPAPAAAPAAPVVSNDPPHREPEAPPAAPTAPTAPPAATEVAVDLATTPPGAKITRDDGSVVCASTPCTWKTAKDAAAVTLTFALDGYKPRQEKLTPDKDQSVSRDLEKDRHHHSRPEGKAEPTANPPAPPPTAPGGEDLLKPTF